MNTIDGAVTDYFKDGGDEFVECVPSTDEEEQEKWHIYRGRRKHGLETGPHPWPGLKFVITEEASK